MSATHEKFVETAAREPGALEQASYQWALAGLNSLRLHPWPVLLDQSQCVQVEEVAEILSALVRDLPERAFGGDPERIAGAYDIPGGAAFVQFLMKAPCGRNQLRFRPDLVLTPTGWSCIEVNGGNPGAWCLASLASRQTECEVYRRTINHAGLTLRVDNTAKALFAHLAQDLPVSDELNTAIIVRDPDQSDLRGLVLSALREAWQETLKRTRRAFKGELFVCRFEDLTTTRTEVRLGQRRLDAIVEDDIPDSGARMKVLRAAKNGGVLLASGPISLLFNNKNALAILSELPDWLTEREREVVSSAVPWTRALDRAETTDFAGSRVFLPDFAREARESLVLKKAASHGGLDVHIGRAMSQNTWEVCLDRVLATGGWVVQRHIDSIPFRMLGQSGRVEQRHVIFGLFVVGGSAAGGFARLLATDGYHSAGEESGATGVTMAGSANADERVELTTIGVASPASRSI